MVEPISDVDHWLETNGIKRKWANSIALQVKRQYPYLAGVMKGHHSNRAELDLVLLVHHVLQGRFPLKEKDKRPIGNSV